MMPFTRQEAPGFWAEKEEKLLSGLREGKKPQNVLAWKHQNKRLAEWFHAHVREREHPRLCAYCDGALNETSVETVDHFLPQEMYPELALCWANLYPACQFCNQIAKRAQWSCRLLRPDADLQGDSVLSAFAQWFEFDPESGRIREAPRATLQMRARVRLTLRVFQLNTPERCQARRLRWRYLLNADRADDSSLIQENAAQGPYRFVAANYLAARSTLRSASTPRQCARPAQDA